MIDSGDALTFITTAIVIGLNYVLLRRAKEQNKQIATQTGHLSKQVEQAQKASTAELEAMSHQVTAGAEANRLAAEAYREGQKARLDEFAPRISVSLYDDGKPEFRVYHQGNPKLGWTEIIVDGGYPNPIPREILNNYMIDVVISVGVFNHGSVPCSLKVDSCYGINCSDVGIRTIAPDGKSLPIDLTFQRKGIDWLNDPLVETTFSLSARDPWSSVEDRHTLEIAIRAFANENGGLKLLDEVWPLTPGLATVTRTYNPDEP